ncbi:response regulator transcription factor [Clostridium sp. CM028]|uniref:response regulator transcription factor n=1 Tax=Clostridium TaxID=1485 RepID=UPI0013EEE58F|nr:MULTISPECIES: response regulator transcription factor [Clostridium]MBU3091440.1 response regulator transcription factor [Clostridium sp. CF011]MBW9145172.1 response regulator transcription factor [Clostridium sp. CM027]MBW9148411.1 response regulator transcription factor [Clostridium sp. CM028]MBZ9609438.1 response regulator transcription factor [Clostridium estertheticum]UVE40307.1 response regulator transcription factor [Clostridium sp. CM027]
MDNILIIEDEEKVSEILKAYLEKEGYRVHCTTKGLEGIKLFEKIEFRLVILDLMLPDISGEEVCGVLRKISEVHIFMLTAKGTLEDRIQGLNLGADEYLVKPFSPRELTARVNALFRRINVNKFETKVYNNGDLEINYDKRIIKVRGTEIALTPNEFDIVHILSSNRGKVFTREQLIERIMGIDFQGFDRTIDVHIKNIRKKIEEDSRNPKYVITVTRIGYKFGGD